ncbi:MAG: RHS repeat-associated core domain-containing protein [Bacteroidetes bacterium]|nr:RHS repeat-associated core domain-containing protein [Bacteroidota bacterium]
MIQENHYYPFGLDMEGSWQAQTGTKNGYLYNSKELNEDFGLNWYDYGARWYDATVGRWWSVDPLGEKSMGVSTYAYVRNSPLLLVDPTGMISEAFGFYYTSSSAAMAEKSESQRTTFIAQRIIQEFKTAIVYILALPGTNQSVVNKAEGLLNGYLNTAGIMARGNVVKDVKNFDISKIRPIDGVAVVGGTKDATADYIIKNFDKGYISSSFRDQMSSGSGFRVDPPWKNPEVSDKGDNGWGYVIATSTQMTNATSTYPAFKQYGLGSAEELVALSILHGMGHLSGIYHGPNGNDGGYMSDGNFLGPMLQNSFEGDINKLIENTKKKYPETMKPILNRWNVIPGVDIKN